APARLGAHPFAWGPGVSPHELASHAADTLRARGVGKPRVGLVLGSGLGGYADMLGGVVRIPYSDVPGLHVPTIPGHAGNVCSGEMAGLAVIALQGRLHYYEGHDVATVVHPVRVLAALGIEVLLVTNAAGGVRADLSPGDLMLITDHLNLMGANPLRGPN